MEVEYIAKSILQNIKSSILEIKFKIGVSTGAVIIKNDLNIDIFNKADSLVYFCKNSKKEYFEIKEV